MSEKFLVGIDLGGTALKAGLFSPDGEMKEKISAPTHSIVGDIHEKEAALRGRKEIIDNMKNAVRELFEKKELSLESLVAIGIGSPGNIRKPIS